MLEQAMLAHMKSQGCFDRCGEISATLRDLREAAQLLGYDQLGGIG